MRNVLNTQYRFLEYLKSDAPGIWESLKRAEEDGLVHIDKNNDAVTATNRLLLTFPELHNTLNYLTEYWFQRQSEKIVADVLRELGAS